MLLSFYTHIFFLISALIFSCSLISFVKRLQLFDEFFSIGIAEKFHSFHHFEQFSFEIQQKQIDERRIREKIENRRPKNESIFEKNISSILDRFTFSNPSKPICKSSTNAEQSLIFVILSRASNFDFRQAIRATWGRNGKLKRSRIHVQTIFFVGTNDGFQVPIRMEQELFNDVVEIGKSI